MRNLVKLFSEDAYWRGLLALTLSFRKFVGVSKIEQFLEDCSAVAETTNFKLKTPSYAELQRPFPDLAWFQTLFEFETNVGHCSRVIRLIPQPDGKWIAFTILTDLDGLKDFPSSFARRNNSTLTAIQPFSLSAVDAAGSILPLDSSSILGSIP